MPSNGLAGPHPNQYSDHCSLPSTRGYYNVTGLALILPGSVITWVEFGSLTTPFRLQRGNCNMQRMHKLSLLTFFPSSKCRIDISQACVHVVNNILFKSVCFSIEHCCFSARLATCSICLSFKSAVLCRYLSRLY